MLNYWIKRIILIGIPKWFKWTRSWCCFPVVGVKQYLAHEWLCSISSILVSVLVLYVQSPALYKRVYLYLNTVLNSEEILIQLYMQRLHGKSYWLDDLQITVGKFHVTVVVCKIKRHRQFHGLIDGSGLKLIASLLFNRTNKVSCTYCPVGLIVKNGVYLQQASHHFQIKSDAQREHVLR